MWYTKEKGWEPLAYSDEEVVSSNPNNNVEMRYSIRKRSTKSRKHLMCKNT